MQKATLIFLVEKEQGNINKICLAMKKRGFGMGKWNGAGGKVDPDESIEECAKRETEEEIRVTPNTLVSVGDITFHFPHRSEWDQQVFIFFCDSWSGDPKESEEMRPEWFATDSLPFAEMWSSDAHWLAEAIEGKQIHGSIVFGEHAEVIDKKLIFTKSVT